MNGLVERSINKAGYCLIKPLVGKPEEAHLIFCHISATKERCLPPTGAEVRFILCRGPRGVQAANVEVVELSLMSLSGVRRGQQGHPE